MKKFIVVLFVLFVFQNIFAQWTVVNRATTLNSIIKLNANNLLLFSSDCVLRSTNGGQNWSLPGNVGLSTKGYAQFVDSLYGWALYTDYTNSNIYRTTNGGVSWINTPVTGVLWGIYFIDRNYGWATGIGGLVMKTTNGGINWSASTFSYLGTSFSICMKNKNVGYILGNSTSNDSIMKTTNGGSSWFKSKFISSHYSIQILFKDTLNGWSLGDNLIYNIGRTTDGGETWSTINTNWGSNSAPIKMYFLDLNLGWVIDTHGQIWKTSNGGNNWVNQRPNLYLNAPPEIALNDIVFKDNNTGWASGEWGRLLKTTNGGTNWEYDLIQPAPTVPAIYFRDINTGYMISRYTTYIGDPVISTFWKSTNQGIKWNSIGSFPLSDFTSMCIVDNNIYLCGGKGYFKSTNGGVNWSSTTISTKTLYSINFINQNTGWVCGDTSTILKTTNGGVNWASVSYPNNFNLKKIEFKNELTGTVLTTSNYISTTTNGGTTWLNYTPGSEYKFADFNFVGANIGFCVANYSYMQQFPPFDYVWYRTLAKTTNNGVTWVNKLTETGVSRDDKNFYSVVFGDAQNGFIPHGQGMKSTTNGGDNWSDVTMPLTLPMKNGFMVNADHGYFVAQDGSLFATFSPTKIVNISSEIPKSFNLHQNYPNPFNPSTRINYELRNTNYVTLKVFDLLGKEVAQLVNEKQNAGSYAVDFNSAEFSLPSGIYFYTLNAGEFKETRKMVLVK